MATKEKTYVVKIDEGKHGAVIPVGVNGRIKRIPAGSPTRVDEATMEALRISNVSFEEMDEGAGTSGGVRSEPAPEIGEATAGQSAPSAFDEGATPPAMEPRSVDNSGGDQPGDATTADVSSFDHDGDGKPGGSKKGAESTRSKGAAKKG